MKGLPSAALLACLTVASNASAHLMQPAHGTLNVVDRSVFSVVSIPAAALTGVDDDGDGLVSTSELARHHDTLVEQLGTRWTLRDATEEAKVVRIDLVLQPDDDRPTDRAAHVVMLHHARFTHAAGEVDLRTDLFAPGEPELTVGATRDKASGSAESAVLSARGVEHAFFAPVGSSGPKHLVWDALALGLLAAITMWWTREGRGASRRVQPVVTRATFDSSAPGIGYD